MELELVSYKIILHDCVTLSYMYMYGNIYVYTVYKYINNYYFDNLCGFLFWRHI